MLVRTVCELTPWSRVIEKFTAIQLIKTHTPYSTRRLITMVTRARLVVFSFKI